MWARLKQPWVVSILGVITVVVVVLLSLAGYTFAYNNRIYPHTTIGPFDFGGKTQQEAEATLQKQIADLPAEIPLTIDGQEKAKIKLGDLSPQWDVNKTSLALYSVGRTGSIGRSMLEIARSITLGNQRQLQFKFDNAKVIPALNKIAQTLGSPAQDAKLVLDPDGTLHITPSQPGQGVAPKAMETQLQQTLARLAPEITLSTGSLEPDIREADLQPMLASTTALLAKTPLTITADNKTAVIDKNQLFSWLTVRRDPSTGNILQEVNKDQVSTFVQGLAKTIDQEAKNAKLGVVDGKVQVIEQHANGKKLVVDKSIDVIVAAVLAPDTTANASIPLPVDNSDAQIQAATIDSLGLKEVIGHAETDFRGSPTNRVHNITTGANFLNGALVAPGKEFSTIQTLGQIDGSTGYLPELVIKEDKTTPEFGGGLCQVSTTLFRSVLHAGLKVTERTNHSYRVSYYEPPVGLDATIYYPKPDFQFVNDTTNYVLIQSKIQGTKISFDLYGTKDGRSSTISDPTVSDITSPPPPQYVDTDTLKKGEQKQIERAHDGATAVVSYTVKYADGKEAKQTFRSKYKAWQARYLVGTREDAPAPTPTPSP